MQDQKKISTIINTNISAKADTEALIISDKKDLSVFTKTFAGKIYRNLIDKMHEGAVITNKEGIILFCNSAFTKMVNLPLQKLTGKKFYTFIDDTLKKRFEALIKQGKKSAIRQESLLNGTDGKQIPVLFSVNFLLLEHKFVSSIIITDRSTQKRNKAKLKSHTKNIEQKNNELKIANKELVLQYKEKARKEEELRIANKKLATQNKEKEKRTAELSRFFQHAKEGILVVNEKGLIIQINLSAEKLFGYEKDELLKKKIETLIPKRFTKIHQKHMENYNRHPYARPMGLGLEFFGLKKNGTEFPVEISLNPYTTSRGNFVIAFIMDITLRKKAEDLIKEKTKALEKSNIEMEIKNLSLEKINKELETFTFVASHDLQEPMRKIKNFVSVLLIEEVKHLSDEGKNYLRRMYRIAKNMQELIENLLKYSRTNNAEQKFEKIKLSTVFDKVKEDFKMQIQEKKATIEASHLCKLRIIRLQFHQLVQNLIDNSLKFSKPRTLPRIKITSEIEKGAQLKNENLSKETDYCHIIYTDNGIGFEPKYNELIFELLQRLHSKEKYKGNGMGLATCKRIVENHNGIITATGRLNKGARFDIYIPVT